MTKSDFFKYYITKLIIAGIGIFVYLPILGGMVSIMLVFTGIVLTIVYLSWDIYLALLTLYPDHPSGSIHYFVGFLKIPEILSEFLILFSYICIIVGGSIFIHSLWTLAKGKTQQQGIVDGGIYGIIRHPQNLGIIVLGLGIMLIIPTTWRTPSFYTLRIGDLFSWLFFSLIWLIEAKWEEERLSGKFKEELLLYQKNTPFIIPWGLHLEKILAKCLNPNWNFKVRVLFWLLIFNIFFLSLTLFLTSHDMYYLTN